MTRIFTLMFLLLLPFSSYAQKNGEGNIKNKTERAIIQIKKLKKGALLVRLFDKTKQIEYLKKQGKSESVVAAYIKKVSDDNLAVIDAYSNGFQYCPVYFFYAKDSEWVTKKAWDKVNFVNSKGEIDSSIKMTQPYFYTSEISNVKFEAAIMMDVNFERMDPPFPYFTRTFSQIPFFKRTKLKAVQRLNAKMEVFHAKYEHLEIDYDTNKIILDKSVK